VRRGQHLLLLLSGSV